MFRFWIYTVRRDDWLGLTADVLSFVGLGLLIIISLLARLPVSWSQRLPGNSEDMLRGILVATSIFLWWWLRSLVYAFLPSTPSLIGKTLTVFQHNRKIRFSAQEIVAIYTETRPPDQREIFVIERKTGQLYDLCPVHWKGAPMLYRKLMRLAKIPRRHDVLET